MSVRRGQMFGVNQHRHPSDFGQPANSFPPHAPRNSKMRYRPRAVVTVRLTTAMDVGQFTVTSHART